MPGFVWGKIRFGELIMITTDIIIQDFNDALTVMFPLEES